MDKITPTVRSRNMSLIRAKNTKPELLVRKALFQLRFRYRIHTSLPGKPDITFPSKKFVVFIHGCFWHGHGCKVDHIPKSNTDFWESKITHNRERDIINNTKLAKLGWKILTIWECEIIEDIHRVIELIKNQDSNIGD